ncbi:hypothetical protein BJV74DRAFT_296104 [Russula compacta]|nr:hypothetical protein BJV74DRAFT_296104 [Russula compacta]
MDLVRRLSGPNGPEANTAIQCCSCLWCSANRNNYPCPWRTIQYQNPWFPTVPAGPAIPYANQYLGVNNTTGIAANVDDQIQTHFIALQTFPQWNQQENAGYAPLHEAPGPLQVQTTAALDEAQILGISVTESLRRLAGRYINSPESLVNAVRLEQGPSCRFSVVIMLEIADIV